MDQVLNRKHSIVYFSDIVGYTLLMGQDEDHAFELMKQNLVLHSEVFEKHRGKIIKELGDGILAIFETAEEALEASLEIQKEWGKSSELELRIGLHCGGIILDHGDVYGDAVNIASRIQSIGVPSCVLFSSDVLANLPEHSRFTHVNLGLFRLKNVAKDLELHALTNPPLATPKRADMIKKVKSQEREPWKFWVALASTLTILLFLIYSLLWNNYTWEKEKSVAVLPFTNIVANPDQAFFAEGLTEDVISHISKIESIKVIDKQSVYAFENSKSPLDSIAEALDVSTILKGSIQWIGDNIRIDIQLIDPIENKNLWNQTYNREVKDIFKVQAEIASKIANVLNSNLSSEEKAQISKEQTISFDAYELYLKGKESYGLNNVLETLNAIDYFKKALDIDPNYAAAYIGLADSYARLNFYGEGEKWLDSSFIASEKALSIDPYYEGAYKSRGTVFYYNGQIEYARISLEKALVLNPNFSSAMGNLATVYMTQGNLVKALQLQIKSSMYNPAVYIPFQITGWIYRILGQPEEALDWLNQANSITYDAVTSEQKGYLLLEQGKSEEAIHLIDEMLKKDTTDFGKTSAGYLAFYANQHDLSTEILEQVIKNNSDAINDRYSSIPIYQAFNYQLKGNQADADLFIQSALSVREDEARNVSDDFNLWLDLAQLESLKGNKSKALEYLTLAIDNGFRDEFILRFNPIFKTYLQTGDLTPFINKLENIRFELNKELETFDLQRAN